MKVEHRIATKDELILLYVQNGRKRHSYIEIYSHLYTQIIKVASEYVYKHRYQRVRIEYLN